MVMSETVKAQESKLTLDDLFATPKLTGTSPSRPSWAPDSRHFAFSWSEPGNAGPGSYDGENVTVRPALDERRFAARVGALSPAAMFDECIFCHHAFDFSTVRTKWQQVEDISIHACKCARAPIRIQMRMCTEL